MTLPGPSQLVADAMQELQHVIKETWITTWKKWA
jgi:hypothetical protein